MAVNNFRQAALDTRLASVYMSASPVLKETIEATWAGLVERSPQGWFDCAGVGAWVLIVSVVALRTGTFPKALGFLGAFGGMLMWVLVGAVVFDVRVLVPIAMGLGGVILVPSWHIWAGVRLLREAPATAGPGSQSAPEGYAQGL